MNYLRYFALALAVGFAACDSSTEPRRTAQVAVGFALTADAAAEPGQNTLVITGTNGTLMIDRIWLVVDELELEGPDNSCGVDECEFETGPFFLKVPLTGSSITLAVDDIPVGTYTELEFEVDDLDFDDDDNDNQRLTALWTQIRTEALDWPREASMLVSGTFTPTGGAAVPFRTYFEAEIELEMALSPALTVTSGGATGVVVELDPSRWFMRADGSVWNLAQWDFPSTGELVEFDLEIERGFDRVRIDRD